jgi:hypothetical protein
MNILKYKYKDRIDFLARKHLIRLSSHDFNTLNFDRMDYILFTQMLWDWSVSAEDIIKRAKEIYQE